MTEDEDPQTNPDLDGSLDEMPDDDGGPPPPPPVAPQVAYRAALTHYDGALLAEIARSLNFHDTPAGRASLATTIADHLSEPRAADRMFPRLPDASRRAMTLFAATETTTWSSEALAHSLSVLGVGLLEAVGPLVGSGLLALALDGGANVRDLPKLLEGSGPPGSMLIAHPAIVSVARTTLPEGAELPRSGPVRQPRETDGLEAILRMAVIWQKVAEAPLRQTQQGTLYKRDRDRLEDDPVLAGPIADALEPLPDMPAFWLTLTRAVGLLESEPGSERVTAARPSFWSENAFHLQQMAAVRWLALRTWHELGGMQRDGAVYELAIPYVRPAILLWLATLGLDDWVAVDDFAAFLRERSPDWDRVTFAAPVVPEPLPTTPPARSRPSRSRARDDEATPTPPTAAGTLDAMLLGAGYQLGLIRAAEEVGTNRRVVQLTPLGRYLLAIGPPPDPRPVYEHFLFVQPNFEVIAYRQGLNPSLIGQFSRFAIWSQVGAATALRLTPESVYRGLEGDQSAEAMLDLLARHNPRPLPAGISEAVRTWAGRRERVTYHASATLVEFASAEELEAALTTWPAGPGPAPARISDRLILVEDDATIPFARFRLTGSRDYRRPPDVCVEVEPDGVTLTLDLARSDLLVDAELARFTDEEPADPSRPSSKGPRRRFVVSAESLARAAESGLSPALLAHWFARRTGGEIPPAIRLILAARSTRLPTLTTSRPLVLHAPSAEILDGLAQHPETRAYLGDRLGPTSVVIPDAALGPFRLALERLGLSLDPETPAPPR